MIEVECTDGRKNLAFITERFYSIVSYEPLSGDTVV